MKILDNQAWWVRLPNDPKLAAVRVASHTDLTVVLEDLSGNELLESFGFAVAQPQARYIIKELIFVEQIALP